MRGKNQVTGVLLKDNKIISADRVILAAGGVSYSSTGSTGEGIEISRGLGHNIIALKPGLVPLEIKGSYPKKLEGLSLKNIRLKISDTKKTLVLK